MCLLIFCNVIFKKRFLFRFDIILRIYYATIIHFIVCALCLMPFDKTENVDYTQNINTCKLQSHTDREVL